ncbi:hypothetical protein [Janthinobacterium sp.]|uniref:hypothetical protein n=1 Tax=Janthinobacterium sp. TaxID=1871054 RepID=UPI00289F5502|nr:hypothetical protein [Janthinobacterium sp.]
MRFAFNGVAVLLSTCAMGQAVAAPDIFLSASPQVVAKGSATSIAWDAIGAQSCSSSWASSVPLTGSYTTPALQAAASYSVTCQGGGATVSKQVMVELAPVCTVNCFTKRWIYFYGDVAWGKLTANADYNKLTALIIQAKLNGYNGIVVNIGGEDSYIAETGPYTDLEENLTALKQTALEQGIELIPMGGHPQIPAQINSQLSEAILVDKTPFVVQQGSAKPVVQWLANDHFANGAGAWQMMDTGTVSFDSSVGRGTGLGSIKLTQPNIMIPDPEDASRMIRKSQTRFYRRFANLTPYTAYRVSFWLRTDNYKAPMKVQVLEDESDVPVYNNLYPMGRSTLADGTWNPAPNTVAPTQGWTNYNFDFNTRDLTAVRFYMGAWANAKDDEAGTAWIDDMQIGKIGLAHTIARPSLPVTVTSAGPVNSRVTYQEGADKDYTVGNESLTISAGSTIADGSQLLVSWYQEAKNMMPVWTSPASACPPEYMTLQTQGYRKIKQLYPSSQTFFINYDEWRIMNWDPSCGNISAATYLANTMTAMQAMVKTENPGVKLYVWNDMFDPYMNAVDKYFMVKGSLAGAATGIHADTVVVNWTHNIGPSVPPEDPLQVKSLKYFHQRDLKQMIALYYDDLALTDTWLDSLDAAEADGVTGVDGFMYTTWEDNGRYDDLKAVADKIKARVKARWPQQ